MIQNNENEVSLGLLTDEAILDFTTETEGSVPNHVLTDHRDLNLKNKPFKPWQGGVYDSDIFGSPIADRCLCGKLRGISDKACPVCGCKVYSVEDGLRRFARIELPFYYLNELRFDIFKEFFDDTFSESTITLKFVNPDLKAGGYSSARGSKKLGIKVFDSCQFEYKAAKKELIISEFVTDEKKCSYDGLLLIYEKHFPDRVDQLKKLINHYYLVQPTVMRPPTFAVKAGKRVIGQHKLSVWYQIIIRLCCAEDVEANKTENYTAIMNKLVTPGDRARYTACLRALLNVGKKEATELLNTSKKNLARELYSVRTKNSARCPIVPSTTLAIDEVELPRHIVYEMCRSGFTKYLEEEYGFDHEQAIKSTRDEYDNPEIQKKFKEYAEQQVVINYLSIVTLGEKPIRLKV